MPISSFFGPRNYGDRQAYYLVGGIRDLPGAIEQCMNEMRDGYQVRAVGLHVRPGAEAVAR